ncbi:MAG: GTP-binding protein [Oscillospiraceae bacterium]|jgi:small GTP-binding protein|nr:GTP-binding protein [Oscillospiraceae bacterium]
MYFKRALSFTMLISEIMGLRSNLNISANFSEENFSPKVLLVGDVGVGKTAVLERFLNHGFLENKPTLGVNRVSKELNFENDTIKMQVFDMSGSECYQYSNQVYYKGAHVAIIVFDAMNFSPFKSIEKWLNLVSKRVLNCKFILVRNKVDLDRERRGGGSVKSWADEHDIPYFETSALSNEMINELFLSALKQSLECENGFYQADPLPRIYLVNENEKIKKRCW